VNSSKWLVAAATAVLLRPLIPFLASSRYQGTKAREGIKVDDQAARESTSASTVVESPPVALPLDGWTPEPLREAPPRSRRRLVLAGLGVLVVALAAGAFAANAMLSQRYSARQAVLDYFAAQAHANVNGMWANATFLKGEGAYSDFFSRSAVVAMMQLPQNRDVRDVRVASIHEVDGSTASVTVDLKVGGTARTEVFTVGKDSSSVHWLFYPSWRVEIPSTTIHLTLPNQAGTIKIDGIRNPSGAPVASIQGIMGFHQVGMAATNFYDASSQIVDATGPASVTIKGSLSAAAIAAANDAVKSNLTTSCDVAKYQDCPGHTYSAPDQNYIYYMPVPGHGNVDYSKYLFTLTGDPTAGMQLTVSADPGKIQVAGSCTTTLTVDGSRQFRLKGDYSGTLTWNVDGFDSDLTVNCDANKA
jgi:hypothetical protein